MRASDRALRELKESEAFSAEPYNDQSGNATIGYGYLMHLGPVRDDEKNIRWTIKQAEEKLLEKVSSFETALNKAIKVPVTQNQFDALLLWVYNCGVGALTQCSWLLALNKGDYNKVPDLMKLWNKVRDPKTNLLVVSNGLKNRRQKEADMFMETA